MTWLRFQFWMFCAYITAIPFVWKLWGNLSMREFQEKHYLYLGMGLVSTFVGDIWMALFFLYNLILLVGNSGIGESYVINIFMGLMIFVVSRMFFNQFKLSDFFKYLEILLIVDLAFSGLQLLGLDPLFSPQTGSGVPTNDYPLVTPIGIFGLTAFHGIFLALMVPVVARRSVWLALALFIPLWLCNTSAGMLAAVISLLFYLWYAKKHMTIAMPIPILGNRGSITVFNRTIPTLKARWFVRYLSWFWVIMVAGTLAVGYFIAVKDYKFDPRMFTSRLHIWSAGVEQTLQRPWGYGPDAWDKFTPHKNFKFMGDEDRNAWILRDYGNGRIGYQYYHPKKYYRTHPQEGVRIPKTAAEGTWNFWDNPHSVYMTILFSYGFVGLILLAGWVRTLAYRFRFAVKSEDLVIVTSMILVYFVSGLTQFPLEVARLAYLFPFLLGAFYGETDATA